MYPVTRLLTTILFILSVVATPIEIRSNSVTLPFTKIVDVGGGAHYLLQQNRARAQALVKQDISITVNSLGRRVSVPVTQSQAVAYVAQVYFGRATTPYNLVVDTGSSNTWVGATVGSWTPDNSTTSNNEEVTVVYGSGQMTGKLYTGPVSFGSGITVRKQGFAAATEAIGFQGYDGILGIGPEDLTKGTVKPDVITTIPTVTQNLRKAGIVQETLVGIYFEPSTTADAQNGELSFGASDSNAFNAYRIATGAMQDLPPPLGTGLLYITSDQYNQLQNLVFNINGDEYILTPNAQIWPRALNSAVGGTSDRIYLVVGDIGMPSSGGLDFVNGMAFLERFYSVYDTDNSRVGFAQTPFTEKDIN
ncbi:hypothetical protein ID866_4782 [Astraeus odoratus]|nr:hypothetical protein ID866_4782 [Astraeus odoratus]